MGLADEQACGEPAGTVLHRPRLRDASPEKSRGRDEFIAAHERRDGDLRR